MWGKKRLRDFGGKKRSRPLRSCIEYRQKLWAATGRAFICGHFMSYKLFT